MSDIWLPMDVYGDDLNLDRAIVNSKRLEKCLLEIKRNGNFKSWRILLAFRKFIIAARSTL